MATSREIERFCRQTAAASHGVIGGAAARALGISKHRLKYLVDSGQWQRTFRDTFIIDGTPSSFRQLAAAASSSGGICSHRCAGALYGLEGIPPRQIEIVTVGSYALTRFSGSVITHRTAHLPDSHVRAHAGISVTSVGRTLIDLAGVVGYPAMRRAAISAVDRKLVTPEQISDQLSCCGRSGRPGIASVRRLMVEMDWELGMSDSDLEDVAFELITKEGLLAPVRLHRVIESGVFLGEVDLAYPDLKIGIEVDSFAFHGSHPDFVRDRGRLNGLMAAGWTIVFFVYEDSLRPRRFLAALQTALNRSPSTLS